MCGIKPLKHRTKLEEGITTNLSLDTAYEILEVTTREYGDKYYGLLSYRLGLHGQVVIEGFDEWEIVKQPKKLQKDARS